MNLLKTIRKFGIEKRFTTSIKYIRKEVEINSNLVLELRREHPDVTKIMNCVQQDCIDLTLDHSLSKRLVSVIVQSNSLEKLWGIVNKSSLTNTPLYAFMFDQLVKARIAGEVDRVRKMLLVAPDMEFYNTWRQFEEQNLQYIDWISILPHSSDLFILEDTWNRILSSYTQNKKRFLAWKVYDYLVKSRRLKIRTSAYFLEIVKYQRREFNKVFSDLLSLNHIQWDQFSCQSIMRTTCEVHRFKKAFTLLEIYQATGKDDLSIYVMLLMKLVKRGFLLDAKLVLQRLQEKNFEWTKEAWLVVANYYASSGFLAEYTETLEKIKTLYGNSTESYGLELKALWKSPDPNEVKAEKLNNKFDEMLENNVESNNVIMNLLIQAFEEMGNQADVEKVIKTHREKGIRLGITSIEIIIRSRIDAGKSQVDDIMQLINENQLQPRQTTYSLFLEALTIHPSSKMMDYYYFLREQQIRPTFDVLQKVLIALEELQDWDSFVVVARHMIVNPHFSMYLPEDLDYIAKGFMLGGKVAPMKLFWDYKLLNRKGLLPTTFAHVVRCFLDSDMELVIPQVWEKAKSENAFCSELYHIMIRYWLVHNKWGQIMKHFKQLEMNEIVPHDICSTILCSPFLDLDFRWEVYLYIKKHHILSENDFFHALKQKHPKKLEVVFIDYQKYGHPINASVLQSLQPLFQQNPQLKTLIEMQYTFESQ
jgi:hypothetical protein